MFKRNINLKKNLPFASKGNNYIINPVKKNEVKGGGLQPTEEIKPDIMKNDRPKTEEQLKKEKEEEVIRQREKVIKLIRQNFTNPTLNKITKCSEKLNKSK